MSRLIALLCILFPTLVLAQDYTLNLEVLDDHVTVRSTGDPEQGYFEADREVTIAIDTSGLGNRTWQLNLLALNDLGGGDRISAQRISWIAYNSPFIDGVLKKGVPKRVTSGRGDAQIVGRILFRYQVGNDNAGTYRLRMRLILSTP